MSFSKTGKASLFIVVFTICAMICIFISAQPRISGNTSILMSPDPDAQTFELDFHQNTVVGIHFNAEGDFDKIDLYMTSNGSKIKMDVQLYKWNTGYRTSRKADPIAELTINSHKQNEYMTIDFGQSIQKGEYLLCITNLSTTKAVGQRFYAVTDMINLYQDGYFASGGLNAYIHFTGGTASLGKVEKDGDGTFTAGPEPTLPPDSPVYTMDVRPDTWTATDGLGRTLDTYAEIGDIRENKTVGIFYWTWHEELGKSTTMIRNNTTIMAEHPEAIYDFNHPVWKGFTGYHFWDEPLFGYYITTDEYVLRKHAEMLADAGVDVVIFDNTNGTFTWENSFKTLLKVFSEAQQEGVNVPKISFMLHFGPTSNTRNLVTALYDILYRQELYKDLWFYWEGKPLMWAYPEAFDSMDPKGAEILDFFTFRRPAGGISDYEWGWITNYPPVPHYDEEGNLEQMAVGVSQRIGAMNSVNSVGRGYSNTGKYDDIWQPGWLYGIHFQEMFDYAIEADPEFLFITGWNEWVAMRHKEWGGTVNSFPDQFDYLRSRDAEPSAGVLRDNYYYVLVNNIRRYKGVSKPETQEAEKTIDISGSVTQWDSGVAVFNHYIGSTKARDSRGYADTHYTSDTMRNDIVSSRVAYDDENIYFYVSTVDALSPIDGNAWMRLLIDTDPTGESPNWEGFEYMLNRTNPTATTCTLERSLGVGEELTDWKWEKVADVSYTVQDNVLMVSIPREILGLTSKEITFNFKWSDNMQTEGEILDFYLSGDVAPGGRFMFHFTTEEIVYKYANTFNWLLIFIIGGSLIVAGAIAATVIIVVKKRKKA